jgi:hypothetical protein
MSARNNCAPGVHQVSIRWTFISYEAMSDAQRRAWDWLWNRLLRPVEESYRPQPEAKGGRESTGQRRDHGASTEGVPG